MKMNARNAVMILVAGGLFCAGYAAGQNRFRAPHTILQVSLIKWRADAPDAEKLKVIEGVKDMAAKIPGIKNVWLKATRMQPRNYNAAIVIEFENREAAERYAESPIHEEWSKRLQAVREDSISPQITN